MIPIIVAATILVAPALSAPQSPSDAPARHWPHWCFPNRPWNDPPPNLVLSPDEKCPWETNRKPKQRPTGE
jgi:hypothetical protein